MTTRYVVTHVGKDGQRTLAHAMQGQHTYATRREAADWIASAFIVNGAERLQQFYGLPLEIREVECWPGHLDPKTCWFD